jgi:DNA-binding response OmpR family regulator
MNNGLRVLIVDVDPLMREFVAEALGYAGFTTEQAADGQEALQRATAEPFDIIMLDVIMPRMDGRAFLDEYLRTDSRRAQIIFCTQQSPELVGKEPSARKFLPKPFGLAELYAAVGPCSDAK